VAVPAVAAPNAPPAVAPSNAAPASRNMTIPIEAFLVILQFRLFLEQFKIPFSSSVSRLCRNILNKIWMTKQLIFEMF
jgi:hypothetical protein